MYICSPSPAFPIHKTAVILLINALVALFFMIMLFHKINDSLLYYQQSFYYTSFSQSFENLFHVICVSMELEGYKEDVSFQRSVHNYNLHNYIHSYYTRKHEILVFLICFKISDWNFLLLWSLFYSFCLEKGIRTTYEINQTRIVNIFLNITWNVKTHKTFI